MPKTRTFLGIAASDIVIEHATHAVAKLQRASENIEWVDPEDLHWTLHFLGEVDDQELYRVCQAAKRGAAKVEPFELIPHGISAFPKPDKPRTLWMGAKEGADKMRQLHAALGEQLHPLGFRGESRRYVPHLTLGRTGHGLEAAEAASLTESIARMSEFASSPQQVTELLVYASRLRREGHEYQVIGRMPLG